EDGTSRDHPRLVRRRRGDGERGQAGHRASGPTGCGSPDLDGAVTVAASGWPIAAMKRCLMNTQSSGGLADGADSVTLATITSGPARRPPRLSRSASSLWTVAACTRRARAAAARSAPCAVGVDCPPVVAYASLSITTTTRFDGCTRPIVASDPRFISSE